VSSPPYKSAVLLSIQGSVQGVGFRFYAQDVAQELGLAGWVRNLPDGTVEAYAEGPREALEAFIKRLHDGPPLAKVQTVIPAWKTPQGASAESFSIR
jgi:acylphosphatase